VTPPSALLVISRSDDESAISAAFLSFRSLGTAFFLVLGDLLSVSLRVAEELLRSELKRLLLFLFFGLKGLLSKTKFFEIFR